MDSEWPDRYVGEVEKGLNESEIRHPIISQGKVGSIETAKCVFDKLDRRDQISFTNMSEFCQLWSYVVSGCVFVVPVNAFGLNGQGREAVRLFRQVPHEMMDPWIYVCVLNACSHSGLRDEAQEIFNSIPIEQRTERIYTIMVNDCFLLAHVWPMDWFKCRWTLTVVPLTSTKHNDLLTSSKTSILLPFQCTVSWSPLLLLEWFYHSVFLQWPYFPVHVLTRTSHCRRRSSIGSNSFFPTPNYLGRQPQFSSLILMHHMRIFPKYLTCEWEWISPVWRRNLVFHGLLSMGKWRWMNRRTRLDKILFAYLLVFSSAWPIPSACQWDLCRIGSIDRKTNSTRIQVRCLVDHSAVDESRNQGIGLVRA